MPSAPKSTNKPEKPSGKPKSSAHASSRKGTSKEEKSSHRPDQSPSSREAQSTSTPTGSSDKTVHLKAQTDKSKGHVPKPADKASSSPTSAKVKGKATSMEQTGTSAESRGNHETQSSSCATGSKTAPPPDKAQHEKSRGGAGMAAAAAPSGLGKSKATSTVPVSTADGSGGHHRASTSRAAVTYSARSPQSDAKVQASQRDIDIPRNPSKTSDASVKTPDNLITSKSKSEVMAEPASTSTINSTAQSSGSVPNSVASGGSSKAPMRDRSPPARDASVTNQRGTPSSQPRVQSGPTELNTAAATVRASWQLRFATTAAAEPTQTRVSIAAAGDTRTFSSAAESSGRASPANKQATNYQRNLSPGVHTPVKVAETVTSSSSPRAAGPAKSDAQASANVAAGRSEGPGASSSACKNSSVVSSKRSPGPGPPAQRNTPANQPVLCLRGASRASKPYSSVPGSITVNASRRPGEYDAQPARPADTSSSHPVDIRASLRPEYLEHEMHQPRVHFAPKDRVHRTSDRLPRPRRRRQNNTVQTIRPGILKRSSTPVAAPESDSAESDRDPVGLSESEKFIYTRRKGHRTFVDISREELQMRTREARKYRKVKRKAKEVSLASRAVLQPLQHFFAKGSKAEKH